MGYLIYDIKCIMFAILCIAIYVIFDRKTKKIQIIDWIMIIILVIVSGIRCNFGSDSYNYYIQYNNVDHTYNSFWEVFTSSYQSGFISLCYIVYKLTHFEFAIFWVVALMTYPVIIIYLRKKTQRPSIGFATYLLMGFFVISNNILKQNIAMIIIIISYYSFLKKKRYVGYIILVLVASKFHITAILAGILIFFGTKILPTHKNLRRFVLIGVVVCVLYSFVIPLIIRNVPFLSRYETYLYLERSTTTIIRGAINIVSYIIVYGILTIILLKRKQYLKEIANKEEDYSYEQISFLFIAIMISIVSIRNQTINRVALYFYQFIVFMIPSLFKTKFNYNDKKTYLSILVIIFLSWFCFNNIFGAENRYYDYSTYFTDIPKSYY